LAPGGVAVPSGPNRFYTFECSAHAAFTLAFAGLGGLFAVIVARRADAVTHAGRREKPGS
jgi:hypothetical protein